MARAGREGARGPAPRCASVGASARGEAGRPRPLLVGAVLIAPPSPTPRRGLEARPLSCKSSGPALREEARPFAAGQVTALGGGPSVAASLRDGPIPSKSPPALPALPWPTVELGRRRWQEVPPSPLLRAAKRRTRERTSEAEVPRGPYNACRARPGVTRRVAAVRAGIVMAPTARPLTARERALGRIAVGRRRGAGPDPRPRAVAPRPGLPARPTGARKGPPRAARPSGTGAP